MSAALLYTRWLIASLRRLSCIAKLCVTRSARRFTRVEVMISISVVGWTTVLWRTSDATQYSRTTCRSCEQWHGVTWITYVKPSRKHVYEFPFSCEEHEGNDITAGRRFPNAIYTGMLCNGIFLYIKEILLRCSLFEESMFSGILKMLLKIIKYIFKTFIFHSIKEPYVHLFSYNNK